MIFSPSTLHHALQSMPTATAGMVGYSGGLDSVVLLHALVQLRNEGRLTFPLRALHVNHGLSPAAGDWQQHCVDLCQQWGVPLQVVALELGASQFKGSGIENRARNARYGAFTDHLAGHEVLLLAHHRDDQMETVLLRLMRGAGTRGLAGMPRSRNLGAGFLFRPLLQFDRSDLEAYAATQRLSWIDDESNLVTSFDRNYCRHTLLPLIEERWPGYRDSWSKSITLQGEADCLLQELAAADLQQLGGAERNELQFNGFIALSKPRQRNLLRYWLVQLQLPEPGWNDLQHLTEEVIPAAGSSAIWESDGYSITCYQNRLVVLQILEAFDPDAELQWNPLEQPQLALPGNGNLHARASNGTEADLKLATVFEGPVQVRYRHGGESLRLRGRPNKSLKKILQEQGIPPWCRERLPLLYADDELIYVPGIGARESQSAEETGPTLIIDWSPPNWVPKPS